MYLRTILNSLTTDWFKEMTPTQNAINKLLYELDQVIIKYETLWGVYKLESLATGSLAEKVQAQIDKLIAAVEAQDINLVRQLTAGTIRMYAALEQNAIKLGAKPLPPDMWEMQIGSKVYRVVKATTDERGAAQEGREVVTLEQLLNLYDNRNQEILDTMKRQPQALKLDDFDFSKGDSLDF